MTKASTAISHFAKLYERPLPFSLEAEMALLGSLLLDPRVAGEVCEVVETSDFYNESHATIYACLIDTYDKVPEADLVQIVEALRDAHKLEMVGGSDFLSRLANETPSAAGAIRYARSIADYSRIRRLIAAADHVMYAAMNHAPIAIPGVVEELMEDAEAAIFAVGQSARVSQEILSMNAMMQGALAEMNDADGDRMGVRSGFVDLDNLIKGLHPGEMIVLGARPSMGKSALAGQIALNGAKAGVPTAFFSLEMKKRDLCDRWLSGESGVDSHKIRAGHLSDADMAKIVLAAGSLAGLPLFVDDSSSLTVLALRAKARRVATREKIGLVVVDYLQFLTAPHADESRQVEVSAISRAIKAMAREMNVPVLVLCQLNRQSENRTDHRPRMSDLRESGSIEQDADVVMLLHYEGYYHRDNPAWAQDNPDKANVAELIVCKQRNGPVGVVQLLWDPQTVQFKSFSVAEKAGGNKTQPSMFGDAGPDF